VLSRKVEQVVALSQSHPLVGKSVTAFMLKNNFQQLALGMIKDVKLKLEVSIEKDNTEFL